MTEGRKEGKRDEPESDLQTADHSYLRSKVQVGPVDGDGVANKVILTLQLQLMLRSYSTTKAPQCLEVN